MFPISAEHGRGVDDLLDAIRGSAAGKREVSTLRTRGTQRSAQKKPARLKMALPTMFSLFTRRKSPSSAIRMSASPLC